MSGDDIDIVERLCRLWDWLAGSGTAADELLEAADQIVRLRAEVERLRAAGEVLAAYVRDNGPGLHDDEAAIAAWQEARRGH